MDDTTVDAKHSVLFYNTKEEYLEVVIPFIKTGLEQHDLVLWSIPNLVGMEDARDFLNASIGELDDYLNKGQIIVQDYKTTYLKSGTFTTENTTKMWLGLEQIARERGFNGLRIVSDGTWAMDWRAKNFIEYECMVNDDIDNHPMTALCTYYIKGTETKNIFSLGNAHQQTIVKQGEGWNRLSPADFKR